MQAEHSDGRSWLKAEIAFCSCPMQWFLSHYGGEDPEHLPGTLRDKPYSDDLLEPGAPLATMFLQWVGQNFPGWPTKTPKLVSCHQPISVLHLALHCVHFRKTATQELLPLLQGSSTLDGAHAALQHLYDKQVMLAGDTSARSQVSAPLVAASFRSPQSVMLAVINI